MSWIVGLVLAVLVLVALEVIVPGGVLGVCAVVCLFGGYRLMFYRLRILPCACVVCRDGMCCAASGYRAISLVDTIIGWPGPVSSRGWGKSPSTKLEADTLMGRNCETLTRLNPSGRVLLDGESYEAYSRDGYIEAHTTVRIVGRDSFKLIIQKT